MTASEADLSAYGRYVNARKFAVLAGAVAATGEDLMPLEHNEPPTASAEGLDYSFLDIALLAAPHYVGTWITQADSVSYPNDPPTFSPFQTIDERRSEAEKVSELIELIRSLSELPFANRLATRLEELVHIAQEEAPDQSEMSSGSLRTFIRLLKAHPVLSKPSVALTPSGNILAEWRAAPNKLCAAELLRNGRVHFVVFAPDTRDPRETVRISGVALPIEDFMSTVEPLGAGVWMRR